MAEQVVVTMADGREITKTEPTIPLRSSTKTGTLGLLSLPLLQILQEIPWPWPWLEDMTNGAAFAQLVTVLMMYITARYTKTPTDGGAI